MSHPSDGALRRMHDEPLAVPEWVGRHHAACPKCQHRYSEIATNAQSAANVFAASTPVAVDGVAALGRFHAKAAQPAARPAAAWQRALARLRVQAPAHRPAFAMGAAALALVLAAATVAAEPQWLQIFQAKQVQPVQVTPAELQGLPDLSNYGTMKAGTQGYMRQVASLQAASALTGLPAVKPSHLPSGVPSTVTYQAMGTSSASFTFSAAKVRAAAARQHEALPAMPANLDGSTLVANVGPAITQTYGQPEKKGEFSFPTLAIAEMRSPRVTSSGASVKEIEDYLLSQPGVSPQLRAQIKAIGDPNTTLPLLIPAGRVNETPVTVHGVQGFLFGDSTGLGAGVLWVKDGIVYVVGGTLSQSDVLAVANSLS